jgi:protein AroM
MTGNPHIEEGRVKMRTLGTVTIGQSPRADLIPELRMAMGLPEGEKPGPGALRIIEAGALDGLTVDEVRQFKPDPGDYVLVTRMADGTPVKIAERYILPRMQAQIDRLVNEGADVIALVCTGQFPEFHCERLLVKPQRVLYHVVAALAEGKRLGVLLPDEDQKTQGYARWSSVGSASGDRGDGDLPKVDGPPAEGKLRIEAASPYGDPAIIDEAARALRDWGAEIVVMDCIGYTLAMKEKVRSITGVPVILARSILGRVLAELA